MSGRWKLDLVDAAVIAGILLVDVVLIAALWLGKQYAMGALHVPRLWP